MISGVLAGCAELALGVKANKGLIPPAAAPTGKTPCSRFSFAMHNNALGNTGCFKCLLQF